MSRSSLIATTGLGLLLATPALATDPTLALADGLATAPSSPGMAIACSPASTVLDTLGKVMAGSASQLDPTGRALVEALNRPGGLDELGIAADGVLMLQLWKPRQDPHGRLSLPFDGDAAAAAAMMTRLGMDPLATDDGWTSTDGESTTRARLADGALVLSFQAEPDADSQLPPFDRGLVDGLPHDAGCTMWAAAASGSVPAPDALRPDQGLALAGFVPFTRGQQGVVRLRPGGQLPAALSRDGVAPVTGSSTDPPSVVLTIAPSAADLLLDPHVQQTLDLKPSQARRAVRALNVGPGSSIAAFGPPESLDFVAMLPLEGKPRRVQADKVARRIKRLARRMGVDVLYATDQTLVLAVAERHLHVEVRDGRVVLGVDGPRVRVAADGEGAPWIRHEDLAWALKWPVAVWTGAGGPGAAGYPIRVRGGLRAGLPGPQDAANAGDVLELGIQVQTNAPPGVLGAFLTALLSQQVGSMPAASPQDGGTDPLAELGRDLDGIALAQERYRDEHGAYLATPEAPRAVAELSAEAHPWLAPGTWRELGWAPEPPLTQATFQVELVGDGYIVHAWLDLDGDGQPAHYVRSNRTPMERVSPDGVE